ncbi:MAG TPA: hypothetical protein DCR64_15205, partial [Vibrio sp.]|nr:hypothetical protein [Vibrio sp.]
MNGGKGHDSVIFDKSLNESTSAYDLGVSKGLEVVEKRGAGTLTLTGHGDTDWTITEGGLAGHAMAMSGDLNLVNAGTFVAFTNTSDRTHEGKITGVGHLTQKGSGITTLAGDNEYSGGTLVE